MKVTELKAKLLSLGLEKNQIMGLSKKELEKMLSEHESVETLLSNVVVAKGDAMDVVSGSENAAVGSGSEGVVAQEAIHNVFDANWSEYVVTLLTDDEKVNGFPKTAGLRRIATKVFGMFSSDTCVIETPSANNSFRSVVSVTLSFPGGMHTTGVSCIYPGNVNKTFAVFPTATAETVSEGRALKKALRFSKLVAEEMDKCDPDEPNGTTDERISSGMRNSLQIMSSRVGIDLLKLAIYSNYQVSIIEDLTRSQALALSNKLSDYNRDKSTIPDGIKA